MTYVFIVTGETGAYDGRRSWTVGAYLHEENAKARAEELNDLLRSFGVHDDQCEEDDLSYCTHAEKVAKISSNMQKSAEIESSIKNNTRGDKNIEIDYTGTRYDYQAVELLTP